MGTGAMGIGADVRHASLRTRAGTLAGRTLPTPRTAAVMAVTNEGLDWLEFSRSDDAQQLSACACVRSRSDPERCESPLCMGQWPPSAQQAIRASGVGNQPAHTAPLAAARAIARTAADMRLLNLNTAPRMLEEPDGVKSALALVCRGPCGNTSNGRESRPATS